jgi:hypothetical protein
MDVAMSATLRNLMNALNKPLLAFVLAFPLLIAACSGGFLVNGVPIKDNELSRYQNTWQPSYLSALFSSAFSASDQKAVMNLISYEEHEKARPDGCPMLDLVQIIQHDVKYVTAGGKKYGPMQMMEEWRVDACGQKHSWVVSKSEKFSWGPDVYLPTNKDNDWLKFEVTPPSK